MLGIDARRDLRQKGPGRSIPREISLPVPSLKSASRRFPGSIGQVNSAGRGELLPSRRRPAAQPVLSTRARSGDLNWLVQPAHGDCEYGDGAEQASRLHELRLLQMLNQGLPVRIDEYQSKIVGDGLEFQIS